MIFNWNINNTAQQLTAKLINKSPLIEWVQVLVSPFVNMYASTSNWMISTSKLSTYTPNTNKLQALLNDLYDPILRRITIHNRWWIKSKLWVGKRAELSIVHVGKTNETPKLYIGRRADYNANGSFVITAHTGSLTPQQQIEIKATVSKYKLSGTIPFYQFSNGVPF